jgi:hypothetical protein
MLPHAKKAQVTTVRTDISEVPFQLKVTELPTTWVNMSWVLGLNIRMMAFGLSELGIAAGSVCRDFRVVLAGSLDLDYGLAPAGGRRSRPGREAGSASFNLFPLCRGTETATGIRGPAGRGRPG